MYVGNHTAVMQPPAMSHYSWSYRNEFFQQDDSGKQRLPSLYLEREMPGTSARSEEEQWISFTKCKLKTGTQTLGQQG